jgi:beta-hydroxylase
VRAHVVSRLIAGNNARIRRVDGGAGNPRPEEPWYAEVRAAHPQIRSEWDRFTAAGNQLPLIDDLLDGPQGNEDGWWRAGGLITRRHGRGPLAALFPETVATLLEIPELLSAMLSVLGPGAELRTHVGDNAGSLNFLIGVDCPEGSGHSFEGREILLGDGDVVVFDDTLPHAAWNRADRPRVLVIGDLLRPLPGPSRLPNAVTQWARHRLSPGYANAIERGAELHRALNG